MQPTDTIPGQMRDLGCCVIIPTYNNDGTLERVIREVRAYCDDVIVVNDGSTDRTAGILTGIDGIHVVTIPSNRGKGNALKEGFKKALSLDFRYAITIDSDGQHFPEDIPAFLDKVKENPGSLIVGARNMDQEGVPGGSSFGHRFSVFWFRVETGIRIADVQTGFRLYPLHAMSHIRFFSTKYEFEVEALVRAAWAGVPVHSVPVKVWYAPKGERVTHFRKYRDFGRTTVLNTILVFWSFIWIRPLALVRILRKHSWKALFREHVLNSADSNFKLASSVALGALFSALPIWGWQMVGAVATAYALKLNKFVTLVFSNLSIPPLMPFMIFASYITGGWVLGKHSQDVMYNQKITLQWIEHNLAQYLVGSLVFSILLGLALGIVAYLVLTIFRKRRPEKAGA